MTVWGVRMTAVDNRSVWGYIVSGALRRLTL